MAIPPKYVKEFMSNPRLKALELKGLKKVDLTTMKAVIAETLADPDFQQRYATYAQKNQVIRR